VNNNLEFLMKTRKLTVSKISKDLGVSRSTIYRVIEGGTPSARLMMQLSSYFGKPVNDLFCA
jgi:transcriptional regulator with XRE-family HTH domain